MGVFPPGYVSGISTDGSDLGPGWGWAASLLADLEQGNLHGSIRFDLDISHPANETGSHPEPECLPLSIRWTESGTFTPDDSAVSVAHANYAGLYGSTGTGGRPRLR